MEVTGTRKVRFPVLQWLPCYKRGYLVPDLLAGLTVAAYLVPISLAYASLAGLPPQMGLYASLFGGLGYALLGTSMQVAMGPTSSIAMVMASTLATAAAGDPKRLAALASLTAALVAAVALGAWGFRLGGAVAFISDSVLSGFKIGVGLVIAVSQLPGLLGLKSSGGFFLVKCVHLVRDLPDTHVLSLAVGAGALALLVLGHRFLKRFPISLAVIAAGILAGDLFNLQGRGVSTIGEIPSGFAVPDISGVTFRDVRLLLPLALACFILGFVEGIGAARTLALKHGYRVDVQREFLAMGAANLAAGLGQGFPIAGGMSQSVVNDEAGARTPAALVFASGAIALGILFLSGPFSQLPTPVLAAVVLLSALKLMSPQGLLGLRKSFPFEFWVSAVALLGVLLFGLLQGVLLAALFSILLLLRNASRPRVVPLGLIPGTEFFGDAVRHPKNQLFPGVLIARVEGPLCYFNEEHVRAELARLSQEQSEFPKLVVLEMTTSPYVDLEGIRMLVELEADLAASGASLRLSETTGGTRDHLRTLGYGDRFGNPHQNTTTWSVLQAWQDRKA